MVRISQIKDERILSPTLAEVINDTTSFVDGLPVILNLLVWAALSFLLASHGGIFAIANISLRVGRLEAYSAIPKDTPGIDRIWIGEV